MSAQLSPTPWRNRHGQIVAEDGTIVAEVFHMRDEALLVNAPETLAALQEIIAAADACGDFIRDTPENAARIQRVQAAWRDAREVVVKATNG